MEEDNREYETRREERLAERVKGKLDVIEKWHACITQKNPSNTF